MNFPWLTRTEIDSAALSLLSRAFGPDLNRAKPLDLDTLVYDYLCDREHLSFDDEANLGMIDGEIVLGITQPIRGRILLDRTLKSDAEGGRRRFTLAHELGHWVLHRPFCLAVATELSLFSEGHAEFEFVGINRSIFPDGARVSVRREEWQANQFAAALLIDRDVLRVEFTRRFGSPPVARSSPGWRIRSGHLREHARLLANVEVNSHAPLRSVFGLSIDAMAIALESGGYAVETPSMF